MAAADAPPHNLVVNGCHLDDVNGVVCADVCRDGSVVVAATPLLERASVAAAHNSFIVGRVGWEGIRKKARKLRCVGPKEVRKKAI